MARGKRRGGRRGMLSKVGRKVGSLTGTAIQVIGLLHGVIRGVAVAPSPDKIPANIVWSYSGYSMDDGSFNQNQAIASATTIAATFLIGWGIKQLAKHM